MKARIATTTLLIAAAATTLAGCGGSSAKAGVSTTGGVTKITTIAGNNIMFDPSNITVPPGPVAITMVVTGNVPHEIEIPSLGLHSPLEDPGKSVTLHFTAKAGKTYPFDCSIHIMDGMTGTITVKSA